MFVIISGACACPTGYTDLGAVCSDVIGCTAATQLTTTTSNCISCDTTLNYDPTAVLNQCVCAAGFYMDALNLTSQSKAVALNVLHALMQLLVILAPVAT